MPLRVHLLEADPKLAAATPRASSRVRRTEADVVLFGHGDPWTGGVDAAIAAARRAGKS